MPFCIFIILENGIIISLNRNELLLLIGTGTERVIFQEVYVLASAGLSGQISRHKAERERAGDAIAGNCSLKIREAKEFGRAPRLIIEKHYRRGGKNSRTFNRTEYCAGCLMVK